MNQHKVMIHHSQQTTLTQLRQLILQHQGKKINIQSKVLDKTFSNDSNTNKQSKVSDAKINKKSKPTKTNKQSKVSDTKTTKQPKVSTKTASNNNKTNNKSKLPGKQSNKLKKTTRLTYQILLFYYRTADKTNPLLQ